MSTCQASGSGSAEPKTRTDSEAKTRKGRLQVQVDSLESLPSINGVFDKKERSRENALCLTICAQRDLLKTSSCLPNRILEVEQLVSFHQCEHGKR